MKAFVRRYGLGASLCMLGVVVLLAGTGASLGYQALASTREEAPAPAALPESRTGGLELVAGLDVTAPLLGAVDPVSIRSSPSALDTSTLPGASVRRELDLERAGLGLDADLELASGSHRVQRADASDASLQTSAARPFLTPGVEAAAAAAAAFTLAGFVAYFWPTLKVWSARLAIAPGMLLYAKITRAEVFDNGVRERIFQAIREHPGMSASDLARLADVSWGTTIYHLDVLEQTRMVSSLRKGRYRRYFENGAALTASKDVVAVLQNPVTAGVVETIKRAPGATQKELAAATNMTPQALHWHLARLVANGVVRKEREGRVVRHFAAQ